MIFIIKNEVPAHPKGSFCYASGWGFEGLKPYAGSVEKGITDMYRGEHVWKLQEPFLDA